MSDRHILAGLDIGSTTTSLLIASARLRRNAVSGRMGFDDVQLVYRPEPAFTPFAVDDHSIDSVDGSNRCIDDDNEGGRGIDERRLGEQLDAWLSESGVCPEDIFAGGALLTGLAAESRNAAACRRLIEARVGEAVVATADDPCLESWLAFLGGSATLSRMLPDRPILQLDIGGGTTNPALGLAGEVLAVGCLDIGARHLRFVPGSYRLVGISAHGRQLLDHLGISCSEGDVLDPSARDAIIGFYTQALEAVVSGDRMFFEQPCAAAHMQVPLVPSPDVLITFSGGVGELIYTAAAGDALPETTAFGDLGIDLARAIVASPILNRSLNTHAPRHLGRATVYGLTLHSTEISGATMFLPAPELLPLRDVPVVARLPASASQQRWEAALDLAAHCKRGACLQLIAGCRDLNELRALGERLRAALLSRSFPSDTPLVLLVPQNQGKTIGNYATNWGRLAVSLLVIDEITVPEPHFVHIGKLRGGLIPVSFSKLGADEHTP